MPTCFAAQDPELFWRPTHIASRKHDKSKYVRVAREIIQEPEGYDVRSIKIQRDLISIHANETIELVLRLKENLHNRLAENALAANQQVERDGDSWLLQCELLDTQGLRLFLMSNAADVEVVSPAHLRCHVREQLETALSQYTC